MKAKLMGEKLGIHAVLIVVFAVFVYTGIWSWPMLLIPAVVWTGDLLGWLAGVLRTKKE